MADKEQDWEYGLRTEGHGAEGDGDRAGCAWRERLPLPGVWA